MASTFAPSIQSYLADAAIAKGKAVKIGSDKHHIAVGAANTDRCIGLLQNLIEAAEETAEVALFGCAKGLLGENVVAGAYLVSHTDGTLVKANAAGDHVIGMAMESGSSGDLIEVKLGAFEAYDAES